MFYFNKHHNWMCIWYWAFDFLYSSILSNMPLLRVIEHGIFRDMPNLRTVWVQTVKVSSVLIKYVTLLVLGISRTPPKLDFCTTCSKGSPPTSFTRCKFPWSLNYTYSILIIQKTVLFCFKTITVFRRITHTSLHEIPDLQHIPSESIMEMM